MSKKAPQAGVTRKEGRACPVSPNPVRQSPSRPAVVEYAQASSTRALPTWARHVSLTQAPRRPCEVGAIIFSVLKEENAEAQRG